MSVENPEVANDDHNVSTRKLITDQFTTIFVMENIFFIMYLLCFILGENFFNFEQKI